MKKGYFWFDLYTTIFMPLGLILSLLAFFGTYSQYYYNNMSTNSLVVISSIFDIVYLIFSIKTLIDVNNKNIDSIKEICALLTYNWFFKTFFITVNTYINNYSQNILMECLLSFAMLGIYYIPNIIYFYKRKNLFENYKEEDLITESEDDADEFIRKLREKNGDIIECNICGKKNSYNEHGTCEECHQKILKRLEEKNNTITISSEPIKINLETIECKVCGKEIPSNGKDICNECESKLAEKLKEKEKRFCTKCGKEIKQEWEFCNYCGNKLK